MNPNAGKKITQHGKKWESVPNRASRNFAFKKSKG